MKTGLNNLFLSRMLTGGLGLLLAGQLAAQTVTRIAAGGQFSLFVKSDGSLWGMGDNEAGQLASDRLFWRPTCLRRLSAAAWGWWQRGINTVSSNRVTSFG